MFCQVGSVVGTVGMVGWCYCDVVKVLAICRVEGNCPEVGRLISEAVHDQSGVFVRDTYFGGCEGSNTAMITELANGDEGVS
jgi:hypothetical protein